MNGISQKKSEKKSLTGYFKFFYGLIEIQYLALEEAKEIQNAILDIFRRIYYKFCAFIILRYNVLKLRQTLLEANTFQEYEQLALLLDKLENKEIWKQNKVSTLYDWKRIEIRLDNMRNLRDQKDIKGLIQCLRQDMTKNIGGICNPKLYNVCCIGTKQLIEDYHNEVIKCIQFIYYYKGSQIDLHRKLEFFAETRHSYGRTALFLSGGASFGKFHFGVMKALYEQDLFPRIIAGSSVGALIAAAIASYKYSDLWKCFRTDNNIIQDHFMHPLFSSLFDALGRLKNGQPLFCTQNLKKASMKFVENKTFLEIYQQNDWILNLTVTDGVRQSDSKLLNYLTAPNVVVWTAIVASCAIPCAFESVELLIKTEDGELKPYYQYQQQGNFKFIDGSVACDLPMNRMSELFNINTFIVSQVNPHVAPFINSDGFSLDESKIKRFLFKKGKNLLTNELHHIMNQLVTIGIIPQYVQGIADLVMQSYQGHVTIAPNPSFYDYKNLLGDVAADSIQRVMQHTYFKTNQRIGHIRAFYGIEREFERYYVKLKNKMNQQISLNEDKNLIKHQINQMLFQSQIYKNSNGNLKQNDSSLIDNFEQSCSLNQLENEQLQLVLKLNETNDTQDQQIDFNQILNIPIMCKNSLFESPDIFQIDDLGLILNNSTRNNSIYNFNQVKFSQLQSVRKLGQMQRLNSKFKGLASGFMAPGLKSMHSLISKDSQASYHSSFSEQDFLAIEQAGKELQSNDGTPQRQIAQNFSDGIDNDQFEERNVPRQIMQGEQQIFSQKKTNLKQNLKYSSVNEESLIDSEIDDDLDLQDRQILMNQPISDQENSYNDHFNFQQQS